MPSFDIFDKACDEEEASTLTKEIYDDTNKRNKLMTSIGNFIRGYKNDSDENKKKSAIKLHDIFVATNKYRKKPLKDQGADITNFLQVMNGRCKPDIDILDLGKWINELSELHKKIEEKEVVRYSDEADNQKVDSATAKKDVIASYRAIIHLLEAHILIEGISEYEDFVRNLNVVIDDYEGSKKSSSETTEPATKPSDNTPTQEELEAKYADAEEWTTETRVQGHEDGDIFYIIVDGKKVFYKLISMYYISKFAPGSEGSETVWEKLVS